ncbi:MAG: aminoacyl-histidine dipeptidase [Clostridia bacterium]|nr:aminoacyl-histidine dipeptidase [Clostridia bacterium]
MAENEGERILAGKNPEAVFRFFEEICAVPHGSYHTKALSDRLVAFAQARGLACRQDGANNVVIRKEAAPGYENAPTVMLQGHIDMVAETAPDCGKDMLTEGLDLFIDGDCIGARGTTLGADNGIAVAMMLALLDGKEFAHPALECVFTADEEVGMLGAKALDTSDLKSGILINLDSEDEKTFTVGCAGSAQVSCTFRGDREPFGKEVLKLTVGGLRGGHSGEQIHEGKANANLVMGRILYKIAESAPIRLIGITGGTKTNAIARECTALVAAEDAEAVRASVSEIAGKIKNEFRLPDPDLYVNVLPCASGTLPFDKKTTDGIVGFLYTVPNGVQTMSADVPGLVQTSLSLGIIREEDGGVMLSTMIRSGINSQRDDLIGKIRCLAHTFGACTEVSSITGAWEYRSESALRRAVSDTYRAEYGEEPLFTAIHAGVECGVFSEKIADLDCISFGPDLIGIHTPDERLPISSTARTWHFLLRLLERLK